MDWPDHKLLTAKEVADYLGLKGTAFREARRAGEVPEPIRIGSTLRWRWAELRRWAEALTLVRQMTPAFFDGSQRKTTESDGNQHNSTLAEKPASQRAKRD